MTDSPRVSVIVPVFNSGQRLVPSIESLLSQSLTNLEIIIVNDASTDDSGIVIDRIARENENVKPVHLTENKGVHEARLAGLNKSTAPWVGFLDADDFARPNMYVALLSAAEVNNVDIVVCGSDRISVGRKRIATKLRFQRSEKIEKKVFEKFCAFEFGTGMLWNKLFRRTVIEPWFDLHFPWRQNINEDLLLNIGCFYNARSVFLLSDILHDYVLDKNSVTSKMKKSWAYAEIFRAYALAVIFYQHLGTHALNLIIDMYRTQLSWGNYQLASSDELTAYKDKLNEATCLLFDKNPYALAAISARKQPLNIGARLAIKSLYASIAKKMKNGYW